MSTFIDDKATETMKCFFREGNEKLTPAHILPLESSLDEFGIM